MEAVLKQDIAHAGGFYPTMRKGSKVTVTEARNQPRWKEDRLVFIEQPGCGCEILISLNEGII